MEFNFTCIKKVHFFRSHSSLFVIIIIVIFIAQSLPLGILLYGKMFATSRLAMRSTAVQSFQNTRSRAIRQSQPVTMNQTQALAMHATRPQAIATPIILVGVGLIGA